MTNAIALLRAATPLRAATLLRVTTPLRAATPFRAAAPLRVVTLTALAGATLWAGGLLRTPPALAVSLGDMADKAATDLDAVPALLAIGFYIVGAAVAGFGLLKLKRHVDHPQQTTLGSGLIAILIGVALIAAPAVINGLVDTFGLGGAVQTVSRPRL